MSFIFAFLIFKKVIGLCPESNGAMSLNHQMI